MPVGVGPKARWSALASTMHRLALEQAMNRLTIGKRSVLALHDLTGLTHREIANYLGLSITSSRFRLHRAHLELRDFLGD